MRAAVSREDTQLEAAAGYYFFAERFGWTKAEVDSQPHGHIRRLREVAAITDEIRAEKAKAK